MAGIDVDPLRIVKQWFLCNYRTLPASEWNSKVIDGFQRLLAGIKNQANGYETFFTTPLGHLAYIIVSHHAALKFGRESLFTSVDVIKKCMDKEQFLLAIFEQIPHEHQAIAIEDFFRPLFHFNCVDNWIAEKINGLKQHFCISTNPPVPVQQPFTANSTAPNEEMAKSQQINENYTTPKEEAGKQQQISANYPTPKEEAGKQQQISANYTKPKEEAVKQQQSAANYTTHRKEVNQNYTKTQNGQHGMSNQIQSPPQPYSANLNTHSTGDQRSVDDYKREKFDAHNQYKRDFESKYTFFVGNTVKESKIKCVHGDLFTSTESLAHCVSEDVAMSAGIAVKFAEKFKRMPDYCYDKWTKKGGVTPYLDKKLQRWIYNLISKEFYHGKPTYEDLMSCLSAMRDHALSQGVKAISMPEIACGLDNLSWDVVSDIIDRVFYDTDIQITVYKFEKQQNQHNQSREQRPKQSNQSPNYNCQNSNSSGRQYNFHNTSGSSGSHRVQNQQPRW